MEIETVLLRRMRGTTHRRLASRMGVSVSAAARIARTTAQLAALVAALDLTLEEGEADGR